MDRDRVTAIGTDRDDWGEFLSTHRDRLRRMVAIRLDHRLRGRIDPSDVIQEAFLEATERRPEYVRQPDADAAVPVAAVPDASAVADRASPAARDKGAGRRA